MLLDALFHNGRITTMDPRRPRADSLGVVGGLLVGFDEDLHGCTAERTYDLDGAPVVPGFHDAHHHLSARGQDLAQCDVSPAAVRTLDALYGRISEYAASLPADSWVLATGFDDGKLDGRPTLDGLDAVCGGRPAWVTHCSHHSGVVNSEAFRRMGFAEPRDVPDFDGAWVERREDGAPTGFIAERALDLVLRQIRPSPFEDFVRAIELGGRVALSEGVTSATEPGVSGVLTGNGTNDLAAFVSAVERDRLGVRMAVMPEIAALHERGDGFGLDLGLRTGLGDDRLRIGAVKVFSDGALSARTAAMCHAYDSEPENRGFLHEEAESLHRTILAAHDEGWQVATHAIGDAAISTVLDAYAQAQEVTPRPGVRHRIEHFGLADDARVARAASLGVIPVPQGQFLAELGDVYLRNVGRERGERLYRQRSLIDAGIEVPGSSDCPVVSGAPLRGIQALVTRQLPTGEVLNPSECLTPAQALRAFTYGSAFADHQEHRKGSLARGKLADFVVLSDDLLAVAAERIAELSVQATVVGGGVRYGEDTLPAT